MVRFTNFRVDISVQPQVAGCPGGRNGLAVLTAVVPLIVRLGSPAYLAGPPQGRGKPWAPGLAGLVGDGREKFELGYIYQAATCDILYIEADAYQ